MLQHKLSFGLVALLLLASSKADNECYICDSSDVNCLADLTKILTCAGDSCYTLVDPTTGKVTRGCIENNSPECTAPNCQKCDNTATANKCNTHNVCKTCDSSKDVSCAQTDSTKDLFNAVCEKTGTQCLINVNANKQVERRCATDADVTACTTATCKLCTGANCNTGIFPENRKQCYQCASTDTKCGNVDANKDTIKSLPCALYDENEKCYTFGTAATSMTRGCVSDTDTNVNKCSTPEANEACLTCTTDNCNKVDYEREQTLKCIQCTSTKDDTKCLWSQAVSDLKNCANKIVYNKAEQCYTQTKDDIVQRGCFYDRTEGQGECKSETSCETCTGTDGCNNKATDFTCIRCRSDADSNCRDHADKLGGLTCRNPVSESTAGCFHGTWNGIVIRGCTVDADERMQVICADKGNSQCNNCPTKDCNINKTSGATSVTITTGLMAVILFALWRLF